MPVSYLFQQPQEAPPDSAATPVQVADSLGTDTTATTLVDTTTTDTLGTLIQLNRDLTEAGGLLFEGEWQLFLNRLYEGLAGLVIGLIPKILGALFVFLLFYAIYRGLRTLLRRGLRRSSFIDRGLETLLLQTFRMIAVFFIGIMTLSQMGLDVTALLAGLGVASLAVGLAARDTLENYISGITILIDRPFRIGDNIVIEGTFGTVEAITLRSTRMRTLNNEIVVMPNTHMINQQLLNHTMHGPLRVEVPFGIAYKEYPQQAREVVLALAQGDARLNPSFPPQVAVTALNASSVDMVLWLFLKDPKIEVPIRLEYTERIREALREADIEIPFPHMQLFLDEAKAFDNTPLTQSLLPPPHPGEAPSTPSA